MKSKNSLKKIETELDIQKLEEVDINKLINFNNIQNEEVYLLEYMEESFIKKIIYDGNKVFLVKANSDLDSISFDVFNDKFYKDFLNFIEYFNKVPFSIWSFYLNNKFYFYDMKINNRNVPIDILEKALQENNLYLPPLLYKGIYDIELLVDKIGDKNCFLKVVNDFDTGKNRMNYIVNKESFFLNKIDNKTAKDVLTEIKKHLDLSLENKIYYINLLLDNKLTLKSNLKLILKTIVNLEMKKYEKFIKDVVFSYDVEEKFVKKKLKKEMPFRIRKILGV